MSRLQLAINVADLDEAIAFYSKMFSTAPAKTRPGYANFVIEEPPLKLVLFENSETGGSINHLGVEVEFSRQLKSLETPRRPANRRRSSSLTSVIVIHSVG